MLFLIYPSSTSCLPLPVDKPLAFLHLGLIVIGMLANYDYHPWYTLRLRAATQLVEWGVAGSTSAAYPVLAKLCGHPNCNLIQGFNEADARKLEALLGEHGWAVYKIMLARMEGS